MTPTRYYAVGAAFELLLALIAFIASVRLFKLGFPFLAGLAFGVVAMLIFLAVSIWWMRK